MENHQSTILPVSTSGLDWQPIEYHTKESSPLIKYQSSLIPLVVCENHVVDNVYRVRNDGNDYILKVKTLKNIDFKSNFYRECYFMSSVPSVRLIERPWIILGGDDKKCKYEKDNDPLFVGWGYLLMEEIKHGSVLNWIVNQPPLKHQPDSYYLPSHFIAQMVALLVDLSCQGILHGDIKLENFVFDAQQKVYLIDFEMSTNFTADFPFVTFLATPVSIYNKKQDKSYIMSSFNVDVDGQQCFSTIPPSFEELVLANLWCLEIKLICMSMKGIHIQFPRSKNLVPFIGFDINTKQYRDWDVLFYKTHQDDQKEEDEEKPWIAYQSLHFKSSATSFFPIRQLLYKQFKRLHVTNLNSMMSFDQIKLIRQAAGPPKPRDMSCSV